MSDEATEAVLHRKNVRIATLEAKLARVWERQNVLITAAQAWVDYWDAPATEPSNWGVLRDAMCAAIAACTTEMKS